MAYAYLKTNAPAAALLEDYYATASVTSPASTSLHRAAATVLKLGVNTQVA